MKWFQNNKAAPIWLHLPSHNGSKDLPSGQRKQWKNCQRTDDDAFHLPPFQFSSPVAIIALTDIFEGTIPSKIIFPFP